MSEERDKNSEGRDDKNKFPQPPPFSFYRIYFIIALIFIGLYLFTSRTTTRETDWANFEQKMLQQGDVDRLVVVNNEVVEVFIKRESLEKEQYEDVSSSTFGQPNEGPHYYFTIGSVDYFQDQLAQAQANVPDEQKISPRFERRRNWGLDALGWIIPIAIFVGIWIFR